MEDTVVWQLVFQHCLTEEKLGDDMQGLHTEGQHYLRSRAKSKTRRETAGEGEGRIEISIYENKR